MSVRASPAPLPFWRVRLLQLPPADPRGFSIRIQVGDVGSIVEVDKPTGLIAVDFPHKGRIWLEPGLLELLPS